MWCQCDSAVDSLEVAFTSVTIRMNLIWSLSVCLGIQFMPGSDVSTISLWSWLLENIHSATPSSGLQWTLSMPSICASALLIPLSLFALAVCFGSVLRLVHRLKDRGIYNGHMGGVCATEFTLDMKREWPSIPSSPPETHFCYASTTDGKPKPLYL